MSLNNRFGYDPVRRSSDSEKIDRIAAYRCRRPGADISEPIR